jgi:hypothetical protein
VGGTNGGIEMESSTVESDMAKLFYFKGLVKKLQAKQVSPLN